MNLRHFVTALLVFLGAPLANLFGAKLAAAAAIPFRPSPWAVIVPRLLAPISIWTLSVLLGWLLARWRPHASLGAVAIGLTAFVLMPLLMFSAGPFPGLALASCEANAMTAVMFAWPFVASAGLCARWPAKLAYAVGFSALAVHALSPSAMWLANDIRDPSRLARVKGFQSVVATEFQSPRVAGLRANSAAIITAADSLRSAPCDFTARTRLHAAILRHLEELPLLADPPGFQPTTLSEQRERTYGTLDTPAGAVVLQALRDGVITPGEIPSWARTTLTAKDS